VDGQDCGTAGGIVQPCPLAGAARLLFAAVCSGDDPHASTSMCVSVKSAPSDAQNSHACGEIVNGVLYAVGRYLLFMMSYSIS
jgi:hypothetical protein